MSTSLLKTLKSRSPFDLEVGSLIPDFVWCGHQFEHRINHVDAPSDIGERTIVLRHPHGGYNYYALRDHAWIVDSLEVEWNSAALDLWWYDTYRELRPKGITPWSGTDWKDVSFSENKARVPSRKEHLIKLHLYRHVAPTVFDLSGGTLLFIEEMPRRPGSEVYQHGFEAFEGSACGHLSSYQPPAMPNVTYSAFYFYFENHEKVSLVRFP